MAGADRLALREHIAVKDLIALGRAMLLPEDDLNLACLLKSPLLGLDEDELFELAWDRGEASLLERLRAARAAEPARFAEAYERLGGWLRAPTSCRRSSSTPGSWAPTAGAGACWPGWGPGRGRADRGVPRPGPGLRAGPPGLARGLPALAAWAPTSSSATPSRRATWCGSRPCTVPRASRRRSSSSPTPARAALAARPPALGATREDAAGPELPLWRPAKAEREAPDRAARRARRRARAGGAAPAALRGADPRARPALRHGWLTRAARKDGEADEEAGASPAGTSWCGGRCCAPPDVEPFDPRLARGWTAGPAARAAGVTPAGRGGPARAVRRTPAGLGATAAVEPEPPRARRRRAPARRAAADSPAGPTRRQRLRRGLLVHRLLQLLPGLPPDDAPPGRPDAARARRRRPAAGRARELAEECWPCSPGRVRRRCSARAAGPSSRSAAWSAGAIVGQIDRLRSPRTRC